MASFLWPVSSTSGTNTLSITCITPFDASMSVVVTCESFMKTFPSTTFMATLEPSKVSASSSVTGHSSSEGRLIWRSELGLIHVFPTTSRYFHLFVGLIYEINIDYYIYLRENLIGDFRKL